MAARRLFDYTQGPVYLFDSANKPVAVFDLFNDGGTVRLIERFDRLARFESQGLQFKGTTLEGADFKARFIAFPEQDGLHGNYIALRHSRMLRAAQEEELPAQTVNDARFYLGMRADQVNLGATA